MGSPYYPLVRSTWGAEERAAIHEVLDSGNLTMGQKTAEFEAEFSRWVGRKYTVMVNSGSSANLIGVAALFHRERNKLRPGDEVIVPALSWATTYYPLQQYGLKLRFVDIELDTLNIDTSRLKENLTPRTRMIVGVNILGNPANLTTLRNFANEHGLIFFEDNCESMGAELDGKQAGTFGDIGTFSTFYSHHMSTIEGGLLTTDDEETYELAKSLRAHGWQRDSRQARELTSDFQTPYQFLVPGYNVRPQEINAAVGLVQLRKLPEMIQARRANLEFFTSLFYGEDRFIIQRENGKSSSYCFTIVLNPEGGFVRRGVLKALSEAGIENRMITGGCFLDHPVIDLFDYTTDRIHNAKVANDWGFFVGNHPYPLGERIARLYEVLSKALNKGQSS